MCIIFEVVEKLCIVLFTCIKFEDKFSIFKFSIFFKATEGNSTIKLFDMSNFSSFSAPENLKIIYRITVVFI